MVVFGRLVALFQLCCKLLQICCKIVASCRTQLPVAPLCVCPCVRIASRWPTPGGDIAQNLQSLAGELIQKNCKKSKTPLPPKYQNPKSDSHFQKRPRFVAKTRSKTDTIPVFYNCIPKTMLHCTQSIAYNQLIDCTQMIVITWYKHTIE